MKIKTYVFDDLKKGIDILKREYGPDTIIIDMKESIHGGSSKMCEISIAIEDPSRPDDDEPKIGRKKAEAIWDSITNQVFEKIGLLESEIITDRLKSYPVALRFLYDKMVKNGFYPRLALSLISEIYIEIGEFSHETSKASFFLKDIIGKKIKINDINGFGHILILGPLGAGKTQTAKKLAVMLSALGKPVSLISYSPTGDKSKNEIWETSEKRGVRFFYTDSIEKIYSFMEKDERQKIIDIPGILDFQRDVFKRLRDVSRIMVFSAGSRDEKIKNYLDLFGDRGIGGVIFTKLDEEYTLGHILSNLILLEQKICCFTTGTDISDIIMPEKEIFYKILLEGNRWRRGEVKL